MYSPNVPLTFKVDSLYQDESSAPSCEVDQCRLVRMTYGTQWKVLPRIFVGRSLDLRLTQTVEQYGPIFSPDAWLGWSIGLVSSQSSRTRIELTPLRNRMNLQSTPS